MDLTYESPYQRMEVLRHIEPAFTARYAWEGYRACGRGVIRLVPVRESSHGMETYANIPLSQLRRYYDRLGKRRLKWFLRDAMRYDPPNEVVVPSCGEGMATAHRVLRMEPALVEAVQKLMEDIERGVDLLIRLLGDA